MVLRLQSEDLVREYYRLVDQGENEAVLALFAEDIVYDRQGTGEICGKEALRRFYGTDRVIVAGRHEVECLVHNGAWVAVRGSFRGTLRDGERVSLDFTDWMHLNDGRITYRQSLFPGRQV